ncbi:MAG: hypothetical protein E7312_05075 [Clostridiales bacterium]|nr:hypothetical protein [Clostridiales bacterium]
MVKKLLKHELIYYFRSFILFLPIVLLVAIMTRVFTLFDSENVFIQIIRGSSYLMLFVACFALILMSVVVGVVRFYKNMYSAEGYLTFALPVKNSEHIFVKLAGALICEVICWLVVILAVIISIKGDMMKEITAGISMLFTEMGIKNVGLFIAEYAFAIFVSLASTMLLYYACITIGQTAKKNRILLAVGAYFIYYAATQVTTTIVTVIFMMISLTGAFDGVIQIIENNPAIVLHVVLGLGAIVSIGFGALCWFITQKIMTKKLNLE